MAGRQRANKKRKLTEKGSGSASHAIHQFSENEAVTFRKNILDWFSSHKRDLPWRTLATKGTLAERAYAVLVSEIMLQQTQVVTVKDYYTKWMARWPTFRDLANANPEEVNEMWSGLGYYSRGRRLLEAAQEMCKNEIVLPCSAEELQRRLPGVGRYTASAVASIVFNEKVAAVDGNVIRVLSRQRIIGSDSSSPLVLKEIWDIANSLIDPDHPGEFNEAMMELGATICTPKAPKCQDCCVKDICLAYKRTKIQAKNYFKPQSEVAVLDIEDVPECKLCIPAHEEYDPNLGVMNYPRKAKKPPPRKQQSVVWILHRISCTNEVEYFVVKRPNSGLLANLWEFPCYVIPSDVIEKKHIDFAAEIIETNHGIASEDLESIESLGNVVHIFSHIHQDYIVFQGKLKNDKLPETSENYEAQKWMDKNSFNNSAASTAMRKVFKLIESNSSAKRKEPVGKSNRNNKKKTPSKNNVSITNFFCKKNPQTM